MGFGFRGCRSILIDLIIGDSKSLDVGIRCGELDLLDWVLDVDLKFNRPVSD